jgi:hypothetical protein
MTDDRASAPDLRTLWKTQPIEIGPVALEQVRADARRSQRRQWLAMAIEFTAAAVVVGLDTLLMLRGPELYQRVLPVLMDAWIVVYLWRWVRAFGPRRLPDDAMACLSFHRAELERRRREILRAWRWALVPVAAIAMTVGVARWMGPAAAGRTPGFDHVVILISGAFMVETLALMWLWMLHRADRLQDRIDELDALGREP